MKQPFCIDNSTSQNKIIKSTGNQIIMTLHSAINLDRNKTYEHMRLVYRMHHLYIVTQML